MSNYRNAAADETVVAVSSVQCRVKKITVIQHTFDAPVLYLQLHNLAAPTLGTSKPADVIQIPAGVVGQPAKRVLTYSGNYGGWWLSTALGIGVTTAPDGLTGPTAGDEPEVIIDYEKMA